MSDERELKMRCLELAATLRRNRTDLPTEEDVVKTATVLYDYLNARPVTPETVEPASTDKPRSRRPAKADILN